jgi:hypothetical protein
MSGLIQAALIADRDPFTPSVSRPEAQKWDSYQTYDLYCEDIIYQNLAIDDEVIVAPRPIKFKSFLAVDKCSVYGAISFDFNAVALMYP